MEIKLLFIALLASLLIACGEDDNMELKPIPPAEPEQPEKPVDPETPIVLPSTENLIKTGNMIIGTNEWYGIAYGNGKYVAVGEKGYTTTSTDGVNWTTPKTDGGWKSLSGIAFGKGKFITGSSTVAGTIMSSTDGNTWTTVANISNSSLNDFRYVNDLFFVDSANGYSYVSADGITWEQINSPRLIAGIAYNNGLYVAVCYGGIIATSNDGKVWTLYTLDNTAWQDVAYGNGKFVAIGAKGLLTTSVDGQSWATPVQVVSISWSFLIYKDGMFVAISQNGYMTTSSDGETWTEPVQMKDETGNNVTFHIQAMIAMQ